MKRPTILDVAAKAAKRPGIDLPSPRWSATLAYLYGLELSPEQITEVAIATQRSPKGIRSHADATVGRRRFRELWARVGRRARKSATAALIAGYEAVWGGHEAHLMPGELGLIPVISHDTAGATVVTRFVSLYAEALGFRVTTSRMGAVQVHRLEGCAIAIATLASTATAPRGYPMPVAVLDEVAHVPTGDAYVDSDSAILAAVTPGQAQFPEPLLVGISTPQGRAGVFHERVESALGHDDEHDLLAVHGPTWEWTPTISEEQTRRLERDPRTHDQEYGANPRDEVVDGFFGDAVALSVDDGPPQPISPDVRYTVAVDPAFAGTGHRFGVCVVSSQVGEWDPEEMVRDQRRVTRVHEVYSWVPDRSPREMARRVLREVCAKYHTDRCVTDQHHGASWQELAADVGLRVQVVPWTAGDADGSKSQRFKATRTQMYEGAIRIPAAASGFLGELRQVRSVLLPSGTERVEVRSSVRHGHGDAASAFVLAVSEALSSAPQLPPSREGWWERRERRQRQAQFGAVLQAAGSLDCIGAPDDDIPSAETILDLATNGELPQL